jgi:hypothetical protein
MTARKSAKRSELAPTAARTASEEWERFLGSIGFESTAMGKGDHTVWRRDGFDRLTIDYCGKHLNDRSFRSSLRTLEIKKEDFWAYLKSKIVPESLAAGLRECEPVLLAN